MRPKIGDPIYIVNNATFFEHLPPPVRDALHLEGAIGLCPVFDDLEKARAWRTLYGDAATTITATRLDTLTRPASGHVAGAAANPAESDDTPQIVTENGA